MSGHNEYSDLFDGEGRERQDGSGLRKQLEDALGEIRSLRSELTQEKRAKELSSLFSEKGKDPAAMALVPQDADPKAWFEANAHLLADVKKAEVEQEQEAPPSPEVPDPALIEEQAAFETLTGMVGTGIPSTASADPIQKLKSFENEEDLLAFLKSQGA